MVKNRKVSTQEIKDEQRKAESELSDGLETGNLFSLLDSVLTAIFLGRVSELLEKDKTVDGTDIKRRISAIVLASLDNLPSKITRKE